jgi:UDP-glucuronate 4-epimerase
MGKKVLVTGAAGFIGSHVVEALLARGDRVVGIDNLDLSYPTPLKRRNLEPALAHPGYRWVECDIREASGVEHALRQEPFDAIIHLAARAGVRPSLLDPAGYCDTNVRGTALLLDAAGQEKVGHFVFASSSSVYGARARAPFREDDGADEPVSPYAATKRAGEVMARTFHHLYGTSVTCLRFFTVYGPRQRPDMAIHRFSRLIDEGRPIEVYGDGRSRRDYTFVDDVVDGVLRALDRPRGYRIYNLGSTCTVPLLQLIDVIGACLGQAPRIVHRPDQPGDVPLTCADVSLARSELGYEPRTRIEDGIARFIAWYREESACLSNAH